MDVVGVEASDNRHRSKFKEHYFALLGAQLLQGGVDYLKHLEFIPFLHQVAACTFRAVEVGEQSLHRVNGGFDKAGEVGFLRRL